MVNGLYLGLYLLLVAPNNPPPPPPKKSSFFTSRAQILLGFSTFNSKPYILHKGGVLSPSCPLLSLFNQHLLQTRLIKPGCAVIQPSMSGSKYRMFLTHPPPKILPSSQHNLNNHHCPQSKSQKKKKPSAPLLEFKCLSLVRPVGSSSAPHTPTLRLIPAALEGKLISTACSCDLVLSGHRPHCKDRMWR